MEPVTVYFSLQVIATTITQLFAARNTNKIREAQERQSAENRFLQLESQQKAIEGHRELAALNHDLRLKEGLQGHEWKKKELDYQHDFHKVWPLNNLPAQIRDDAKKREYKTLIVLVAPLATSQNESGGIIPAQLLEKQQALDVSLKSFLNRYYHRDFDRPVYYIHKAWKPNATISSESAVMLLSFWMPDVPILVLQPSAVGTRLTEINFWFWDLGITTPHHGSFPLSNGKNGTAASAFESPEALSRVYEFLVATVADWRLLAKSQVTPHFPSICQTYKTPIESGDTFLLDALDSAITGYEKVIAGIKPDKALRIYEEMKSTFEELGLKSGVARMNDCIRKMSPAMPKRTIGNIKDYVSQFGA
jgi:hypothetical protein